MRAHPLSSMLLGLGLVACTAESARPSLDLSGLPTATGASAEGEGMWLYLTDPGTARGDEQDPELDDALIALLDAATTSIDLCLYEFKLEDIADAVIDAQARGVEVRMVTDGDELEDSGTVALAAAGVPIVARNPGNRIMHNKFVVVDGQAVWTGSTNLTPTGLLQNNNHALLVESTTMAEEFTREFEQMFEGEVFGRSKSDLGGARSFTLEDHEVAFHFAPQHDPIDELISLVDSADHSIRFLIFSFTHPDLVDALLAADARGVEVVGVFDTSQAYGSYSQDETLAAAGLSVYLDGNGNASGYAGGKLHHKVMLIDAGVESSDPVVALGSFNWSRAGTDDNDENLVEIRDPAILTEFAAEFCRVLDVAEPHPDAQGDLADPCGAGQSIFINEVLADPAGTDRGSEFIELFNGGTESVSLDGWTLGDLADSARHTFGAVVLDPGEGLVVFDTGDHSQTPNASVSSTGLLSLNNGSETVTLARADGTTVDSVSWTEAVSGVSWNRSEDLSAEADLARHDAVAGAVGGSSPGTRADGMPFDWAPTPEFQVVLNELLANPVGTDRGQEFVEMVNLGPDPADLDGFVLFDGSGERHAFSGTVLAPGEALVLFDQGDHSDIPGAMTSSTGSLSLNNAGDVLTLVDAEGSVHDEVSWTTSEEGVSWNRAWDGGADAALQLHDTLTPSGMECSPGLRVSGLPW